MKKLLLSTVVLLFIGTASMAQKKQKSTIMVVTKEATSASKSDEIKARKLALKNASTLPVQKSESRVDIAAQERKAKATKSN